MGNDAMIAGCFVLYRYPSRRETTGMENSGISQYRIDLPSPFTEDLTIFEELEKNQSTEDFTIFKRAPRPIPLIKFHKGILLLRCRTLQPDWLNKGGEFLQAPSSIPALREFKRCVYFSCPAIDWPEHVEKLWHQY